MLPLNLLQQHRCPIVWRHFIMWNIVFVIDCTNWVLRHLTVCNLFWFKIGMSFGFEFCSKSIQKQIYYLLLQPVLPLPCQIQMIQKSRCIINNWKRVLMIVVNKQLLLQPRPRRCRTVINNWKGAMTHRFPRPLLMPHLTIIQSGSINSLPGDGTLTAHHIILVTPLTTLASWVRERTTLTMTLDLNKVTLPMEWVQNFTSTTWRRPPPGAAHRGISVCNSTRPTTRLRVINILSPIILTCTPSASIIKCNRVFRHTHTILRHRSVLVTLTLKTSIIWLPNN